MGFVESVTYEQSNGTTGSPENIPTWKAERVHVSFACPICGTARTDVFTAPLSVDARAFCDACENTYFIRRPAGKHEDAGITVLIEEQLESNSIAHPLAEQDAEVALLLATRVQTVLFSGLAVSIGATGSLYGVATLFSAGGVFTKLGLASVVFAAVIGFIGVTLGGLRSFVRGYLYCRNEEPDTNFPAFIGHVGRYYHEEPFRLT